MISGQTPALQPRERLTAWELLVQTYRFVNEHEIWTRASAIAFSGMMAAVPFLAMLLTICVHLLPDIRPGQSGDAVNALTVDWLTHFLKSMFPADAYAIIAEQIARIQQQPPVAWISISVAITMWCASGVFMGIIDALNHIYGVKETRPYWRLRLRAMGMTLVQIAIVLTALLAIIFWPQAATYLGLDMGKWWFSEGVTWLIIVLVVLTSFALSFHIGPDAKQAHRWITPGSIIGTLFFMATCYGVKRYVAEFAHYDRVYGSLGGVMTLLLWFYISSLVLLLAAEINRIIDYAVKRAAGDKDAALGECVHQPTTAATGNSATSTTPGALPTPLDPAALAQRITQALGAPVGDNRVTVLYMSWETANAPQPAPTPATTPVTALPASIAPQPALPALTNSQLTGGNSTVDENTEIDEADGIAVRP